MKVITSLWSFTTEFMNTENVLISSPEKIMRPQATEFSNSGYSGQHEMMLLPLYSAVPSLPLSRCAWPGANSV